jgi:hypothetical protein
VCARVRDTLCASIRCVISLYIVRVTCCVCAHTYGLTAPLHSASGPLARHWASALLAHLSTAMAGSARLASAQLAVGRVRSVCARVRVRVRVCTCMCRLAPTHIQRFGIVTANASLIVLDKLEQYLKHDIPPPSS